METTTYQHLTESDRKMIRTEMKPAKGLFFFFCMLAAFCAVVMIFAFKEYVLAIVGAAGIVFAGYQIFRYKVRDYLLDLKEDEKKVVVRDITALELNPVDGDFKGDIRNNISVMRHPRFLTGHYVKIGNLRYPVTKEVYEQLQGAEKCAFHISSHSETFLGIYPIA